jgi:hypothetical protein
MTASARASLANRFLSLAGEGGLKMRGVRSFLRYCESLGLRDPVFYCSKTSKAYYPSGRVMSIDGSKIAWGNWDISWNGRHLTAKISVFRRTANACSLSDILEDSVDEKYFLSEAAVESLRRRTVENQKEERGFRAKIVPRPSMPDTGHYGTLEKRTSRRNRR